MEVSMMATSTSLCTTSSTVVTSSAVEVITASPGSKYTCTPNLSANVRNVAHSPSTSNPSFVNEIPPPRLTQSIWVSTSLYRLEIVSIARANCDASVFSQLK